MGNKVIIGILGIFVVGTFSIGCVALPPAEYQEEYLGIVNDDSTPENILEPPEGITSFISQEGNQIPLGESFCDCRFGVTEENGLTCLRMTCSESCPEATRECASTIGGCTLSR